MPAELPALYPHRRVQCLPARSVLGARQSTGGVQAGRRRLNARIWFDSRRPALLFLRAACSRGRLFSSSDEPR